MQERSRSGRALPGLCAAVVAAALGGCGDLALTPDRVPSSLSVEPRDTLITQGDAVQLRVAVLDQHDEPMEGFPSWAPPDWSISDPEALSISPRGLMDGTAGGDVKVEASLAGLGARIRVRVNPTAVGLDAPAVYLVQSIQNQRGDVPLVAGRNALLRVFMTGDRVSFYRPRARATFYLGGEAVLTAVMSSNSEQLPDGVEEGRIDRSFNVHVPGELVRPGLEMVVELDPDGVVPLGPGSRVRIPAQGRAALEVNEMPPLELVVVPVLLSLHPNNQVFNWTDGLTPTSRQLELAREVHPIGELRVTVHDPYTSSADLTTDAGWNAFLREISLIRIAEGERGYYYGAVQIPPRSAWGGLGYIGWPASVGSTSESTFAHELGHNLSLRHAPCGNVSSFDPGFPYGDGSIGVWGYDFLESGGVVVDPSEFKDLMSYCGPRWVSDYHFKKATAFRLQREDSLMGRGPEAAGEPRPVMLLWGSVGEGGPVLEPAFAAEAPPVLPESGGPYTLEGYDDAGAARFSLRFAPLETSQGGRHFAFAVPMDPAVQDALDRIVLRGPEGTVTRRRADTRRAALVTDEATGRVRAVVRDWRGEGPPSPGTRVRLSDGLPARGPGEGIR